MKSNGKRVVAMFLFVTMLLTSIPSSAFAEETAVPVEVSVEPVTEAPAETPATEETYEEPAVAEVPAAEEPAPEITEETPADAKDPALETVEETPAEVEEPAAQAAVETPEATGETPAAEEEARKVPAEEMPEEEASAIEEEISFPAQSLKAFANGISVKAEAPEGALPEGAKLNVVGVDTASFTDAVQSVVSGKIKAIAAADLSFTDKSGNTIQPQSKVKITLTSDLIAEEGTATVVHIKDGAAEILDQTALNKEEKTAVFENDSFSPYAIVLSETAQADGVKKAPKKAGESEDRKHVYIKYVVQGTETTVAKDYTGDFESGINFTSTNITHPQVVGYKPAANYRAEDAAGITVTYTETNIKFSFANIQKDYIIYVEYVPAEVSYTVNYYQQNIQNDDYTLAETESRTGITGQIVDVEYESVKDKYQTAGFYGLQFERPTIAANGSTRVDIYYDREYRMIKFDLDGGYGVDPIYARVGTSIATPENPKRPGYTFTGWDKEIPQTMPNENVTIKASWQAGANNVNYTVVFWYENADDTDYSVVGSVTESALAGTSVNASTFQNRNFTGRDNNHFTYNPTKTEETGDQTVAGDGTTVLNVYFSRNEYTLRFYQGYTIKNKKNHNVLVSGTSIVANSDHLYSEITAKYGANIADSWPISYTVPSIIAYQEYLLGGGSDVTYKFSGWKSDIPNDTIIQVSKVVTMIDKYCDVSDGVVIFKAEYSTTNQTRTLYYMAESEDQSAPENNITRRERNGVYYDSIEKLQETVNSDSNSYGPKPLFGYEIVINDQGNAIYNTKISGNNRTYWFYYKRNRHTITFNSYGKDVRTVTDVMYDQLIKNKVVSFVPTYPDTAKPGALEFTGWYTSAQCLDGTEVKWDTMRMPDNEMVLFAGWRPVKHNVNIYKDSTLAEKIGDTQVVSHGAYATAPDRIPENGRYKFVGWFYTDNGTEKAFDFEAMPVQKDLDIYAKWSSDVLMPYTIHYVLESDKTTKVADDLIGYALAGTNKTFEAATALYPDYSGETLYFPTARTKSLMIDIEDPTKNELTFTYVSASNVPYTVKYLEQGTGKELHEPKVVANNTNTVITEQFEAVTGYMPDAFSKQMILQVPATGDPTPDDNVLIFYYTKDEGHAFYQVTHYVQDGDAWKVYVKEDIREEINKQVTVQPLEITHYVYRDKAVVDGLTYTSTKSGKVTDTGLQLNLYYISNEFKVYHTSNDVIDTLFVDDYPNGFNITERVNPDFLYGGVGSAKDWETNRLATLDANGGNGLSFQPEAGKTYYLVELQKAYMLVRIVGVTRGGAVYQEAVAGALDYANAYNGYGFKVNDEIVPGETCEYIETELYNGTKNRYYPQGLLGITGECLFAKVLESPFNATVRAYWITKDNVRVYGTRLRTLEAGRIKSDDDSLTVAYEDMRGVGVTNLAKRKMFTLSALEEIPETESVEETEATPETEPQSETQISTEPETEVSVETRSKTETEKGVETESETIEETEVGTVEKMEEETEISTVEETKEEIVSETKKAEPETEKQAKTEMQNTENNQTQEMLSLWQRLVSFFVNLFQSLFGKRR